MPTLEELDGRWPDPPADATPLEKRCVVLRRLPLDELDSRALRVLLGQRVSVRRLLPLAVDALAADVLAPGDHGPGELLAVVLRLPPAAWADDVRARFAATLQAVDPSVVPAPVRPDVQAFLAG